MMMYPESSDGLNRETDIAIYFFTTTFSCFSNFSSHAVQIWTRKFNTSEHAFQWKKFSEAAPDIAEKIFNAGSAEAAKRITIANRNKTPQDWDTRKVDVMREVLAAKLAQHEDVREQLLKTGTRDIVENALADGFWGNGPDGKGENWVGKIWMELREKL